MIISGFALSPVEHREVYGHALTIRRMEQMLAVTAKWEKYRSLEALG